MASGHGLFAIYGDYGAGGGFDRISRYYIIRKDFDLNTCEILHRFSYIWSSQQPISKMMMCALILFLFCKKV